MKDMQSCSICPRSCNVKRTSNNTGYCRVPNMVRVARASLHMWEEPCISGDSGSGTVFFSGCNLRCVYCQNHAISGGLIGKDISTAKLSDIFLSLEQKGANNINLVTPSHYVYQIIEALNIAHRHGLSIPIVYNTGSYETVSTLKDLEGYIDIYLPDCKYYSDELAIRYSNAPDYFNIASNAILEMLRQVKEPVFNENGIMTRGIIIRHMTLPGHTKDSMEVLRRIYKLTGENAYFSIMSQYTPLGHFDAKKFPELTRKVTKREYNKVIDYAIELGIENAFIQDENVSNDSFIPDFDLSGI